MVLTSPLCTHSPEVGTVAGAEEMSFSSFVQMRFEKLAQCTWSPLFAPKLTSCFPPETTKELLKGKKKSHQMRGNLSSLLKDPSLQACFRPSEFSGGLLKGGHRCLPFLPVSFHLLYKEEKMPMLSSFLSPQCIHSAVIFLEG